MWRSWIGTTGCAIALVTASGCAAVGGASPPAAAGDAVAVVVSGHANAPAPALVGDGGAAVDGAVRSGGRASVVVASGTPAVTTSGSVSGDCNNPTSCAISATTRRAQVLGVVSTARATVPETDLLAAIALGRRTLGPGPGPRTLVVVDPGLSTTGALRFQDPGMLDARPDDVAGFLQRTGALPDLAGVRVVLSGIGDVTAPQAPLDTARRRNLVDIWTAVVRASGAADVRVDQAPQTAPTPAGLPPVTPVPVTAPARFPTGPAGTSLAESEIGFRPDSAELIDPAATHARLAPLAAVLRDGSRVVLTGTTATAGSPEGRVALSTQRAQAVALVLADLGVPAERITARGVGTAWPGHVPDLDPSGRLLPGPAARNRVVVVQRRAP